MEEKKLTDEGLKKVFFVLKHGSDEGFIEYVKSGLVRENEYNRQKAEIERLTKRLDVCHEQLYHSCMDKGELQKQVDSFKEERENMQAVIFGLEEEKMRLKQQVKEYQDKIEQGTLIDIKTISKLLNEWFECPCNFTLNEEDVASYMFEKYGDWCDKNCDKMLEDYSPCWEMYLKAKLKELQNG